MVNTPKDTIKENSLLSYVILLLFCVWAIFDPLKYSWSDDAFQKVVLAPLGEEPFKLLFALFLMFCLCILPSLMFSKGVRWKRLFYYAFIPFFIASGIWFGFNEGSIKNIFAHFSLTTIASILLLFTYKRVENKDWKFPTKVLVVFSSILPSMILHSILNQYANIKWVVHHPEFQHLVIIAKFLEEYTFLNEGMFTSIIFCIACWMLICFYLSELSRYIEKWLQAKRDKF